MPHSPTCPRSPEKPTVARCCAAARRSALAVAAAALAALAPPARADAPVDAATPVAAAAAPITEAEAVARALAHAPVADVIDAEVAIEQGRARAAAARPNPELAYVREQTFGAGGTGDDYLTVAHGLDLGGRRRRLGEAGDARARAAALDGDAWREELAADARQRHAALLHRQLRVAALQAWVARLDEALARLARRQRGGEAASYDQRRLERERATAAAQVERERAEAEHAAGRLAALLGDAGGAAGRAAGPLPPPDEPPALDALRAAAQARPALRALALRADAASLDGAAAARWWAPDLRLEAGWKGTDLGDAGRADGLVLGVSLALPLWDRAQGDARRADGEARAARGRRALLAAAWDAELAAARAAAVRLQAAAATLRAQTAAASGEVLRIAVAGYEGGELGLLELLDAHRGLADDELAALDLEYAARLARLELDRLAGEVRP